MIPPITPRVACYWTPRNPAAFFVRIFDGKGNTLDKISFPLFLPATRMDRIAKAARSGADAVIVDLEDAVDPEQKDQARLTMAELLSDISISVPLILRINSVDTPWHRTDVHACAKLPFQAVMLAKAESAEGCDRVARETGKPVVALIETAMGLARANDIAQASARLAFGSIDYAADLGIAHRQNCLLYPRSMLVLAARLAGQVPPLDGVTTDLRDAELIQAESRHSREMGFGGKLLIHPAQVAPARLGFAPSPEEILWAERVIAAAVSGSAAVKVDGMMVDAPVIKRARAVQRLADNGA